LNVKASKSCATAQAISARLPTSGSSSGQVIGFVVDKIALGQVFSEYFSFQARNKEHSLLRAYADFSYVSLIFNPEEGCDIRYMSDHTLA
jgi:hypothetical protein